MRYIKFIGKLFHRALLILLLLWSGSVVAQTTVIDADFSTATDGFDYLDDTFRNTARPAYASGSRVLDDGFSGAGLRVLVGGVDNASIRNGMSGGWRRTFSVSSGQTLSLSFRYRLRTANGYESDEFSEALLSVDGSLIGLNGNSYLAQQTGNGNGGSRPDTGWRQAQIALGALSTGSHTLTLGGYNNKKTVGSEFTEVFFDDVLLTATAALPPAGVPFSATFDAGSDGFVYADDTARGTSRPGYASGGVASAGGFSGGGLRVLLGGIDGADILGMSGGWRRAFTLADAATVRLTLRYRLEQSPHYESDELSQALVQIDDTLYGSGGDSYLAQIAGDGENGPVRESGWQTFSVDAALAAGDHTLTLSGYNSKKTFHNETTQAFFDDVSLSLVGAPSNGAPVLTGPGAQSGTVGVAASLGLSASDPDGDTLSYSATGLPPGLSMASASGVVSGTPTTAGSYGVTATVSDGSLSDSTSFTWTIAAAPASSETLFTTQTPALTGADDGVAYELGMKFQSQTAGRITALRFWKSPGETGAHVGRVWSASGTLLASVTFANETASGWQQQALATPLAVQANTPYLVSANINTLYVITVNGLENVISNGSLRSVADGANGVFGSPGAFPADSFSNSNYFRDVVFEPDGAAGTPTQLTLTPASITAGVGAPVDLVATVRDANGNTVVNADNPVSFGVTGVGGSFSPSGAVVPSGGSARVTFTPSSAGSGTVRAASAGLTAATASLSVQPSNPIFLENLKPGTSGWQLTKPVDQANPEIAGFADATSYALGDTARFKVSLKTPGRYTLRVYRLGYYDGRGGRLVHDAGTLSGVTQAPCGVTDAATRLIECVWNVSHSVPVSADWTTGMYIANLTEAATGRQSQIWFVIRDDSRDADIIYKIAFANYLAYNHYGTSERYSLYEFNSSNSQRAYKVSFDRPFGQVTSEQGSYNHMLVYDYPLTRWLESQGYDVAYTTDVDVDSDPGRLLDYDVFLSGGHDEYWSLGVRDAVEDGRDAGVNLLVLSANTAYWRVRFEPSGSGQPNRVMVSYKNPLDAVDPVAPTYLWRGPENNRPENALLGVMYVGDDVFDQFGGYDFIVSNANDPYYANTGLADGDSLFGLVGYEWDAVVDNGFTPPGLVILSESSPIAQLGAPGLPPGTNTSRSNAVRYTAASGAKVFAVGSIQWLWALDSTGISPQREDPAAKQLIVNVLADMNALPLTPDAGIAVP